MTYDIILTNSKSSTGFYKVRGIGPHLIAEEARKLGYSAIVIDFIEQWSKEDFIRAADKLVGANTRCFGVSTTWAKDIFTGNKEPSDYMDDWFVNGNFEFMVDEVKKRNPNIKVILGGKKGKALGKHFLQNGYVDYIFDGYAETTFIDWLLDKKIFNPLITYDNRKESHRALMSDEYSFVDAAVRYPENTFITKTEMLGIELTRGCRFSCKFCSFPMIGQKRTQDYMKTKECVRDHFIRNYEMFGVTKYSFQDDTFNDSIEKVQYFADIIESLPFKIHFWCYSRAEMVVNHPEMIQLLYDMGLATTWFGIETYNQQSGKCIGKGMDPERIKDMLYQCKSVWGDDVFVQQGYIVGLPYESVDDLQKTKEWLLRPDCPIDECLFQGLHLRSKKLVDILEPSEVSVFDREYEKYGYYFPGENEFKGVADFEKGIYWEKDDDTGVNDFWSAVRIAKELSQETSPWTTKRWPYPILEASCVDYPSCGSHDLDWPELSKVKNYGGDITGDTFKQKIKEHYIEPFLNYKGIV